MAREKERERERDENAEEKTGEREGANIIIIYDAYAMNNRLLSITLIVKRKLLISLATVS